MQRGAAGFFGKVASHGDFVVSRFDRGLRQTLDGWLQRSIDNSRRLLGAQWEQAFEAMPAWRFLLLPGLAGRGGFAGLMVPSRDRVGRHFPLLVAAPIAPAGSPKLSEGSRAWFDDAERILLGARGEGFDLARFDDAIEALDPVPVEAGDGADARGRSFWWTRRAGESSRRFSAPGLPAPENFARFLGGEDALSNVVPLPLRAAQTRRSNLVLRAAAASHPGTRLRVDASAATSGHRGDLHALAQGIADTPAAAQIATQVIDRLGRIAPAARLEDLVAHAKGALGTANTLLRRIDESAPETAGASIVALLAAEGRHAVLWAGDLRCYLLRDGLMRCLTRDHVEIGLRRRVARSVGGMPHFSCDVVNDELLPGDRFLLAGSDLVRLLGERDVAARLAEPHLTDIPAALVEDALIAGTGCNIAAVAVAAAPLNGEVAA